MQICCDVPLLLSIVYMESMSVNVSPNPHAQNNKLVRKIHSEEFYDKNNIKQYHYKIVLCCFYFIWCKVSAVM
ncbi:MAG TPA: hypothetical protein DEU03_13835 [Bacillus sp. (in: Bacteria)]|uniref:Uncharacterized protein n=7 Tax=Bacillus cereus group TaxID=86661 RepID=A0A9X0VFG3_BACTU|nr:hypothetical protein BT4G5_23885 [Bacillus thuringiensis serovar galleriae]AKJ60330.1 hypothetical protein XI92_19680 [Bacillus thuringiensis]ALC50942.1 hypothetical protein ACN91_04945 [Bacillus cereus]KAB7660095.1 hypothetical protein GBN78_00230 [Bacillus sp. B2-WWTP-C-10-Post-4]KAB7684118.1 hypothetical protein GBN91_04060 [Bacillus sp. B1-WWTP-T-0.5-Post-4]MBG0968897.1 hypothetical protein [Bacillus sp. SRB3LM]MDR4129525.1 hypothetical protein [Bacillus cereus ATCC 10876]NIE90488.1 h